MEVHRRVTFWNEGMETVNRIRPLFADFAFSSRPLRCGVEVEGQASEVARMLGYRLRTLLTDQADAHELFKLRREDVSCWRLLNLRLG